MEIQLPPHLELHLTLRKKSSIRKPAGSVFSFFSLSSSPSHYREQFDPLEVDDSQIYIQALISLYKWWFYHIKVSNVKLISASVTHTQQTHTNPNQKTGFLFLLLFFLLMTAPCSRSRLKLKSVVSVSSWISCSSNQASNPADASFLPPPFLCPPTLPSFHSCYSQCQQLRCDEPDILPGPNTCVREAVQVFSPHPRL